MPAAAWAWRAQIRRFNLGTVCERWCDPEQPADVVERGLAAGIGEQAIVADAVEARGQDMEQEAADVLVGG